MFVDNAKYEWNDLKWLNVDLPNLTSINSERLSFEYPCVVTLESIIEYWILIVSRYSKSSKCQTTLFIQVCSIKISFEYCLIDLISFIDNVSSILSDLVHLQKKNDNFIVYSHLWNGWNDRCFFSSCYVWFKPRTIILCSFIALVFNRWLTLSHQFITKLDWIS